MRTLREHPLTSAIILAIILAIPLFITLLTGMVVAISDTMSIDIGTSRDLLLKIHNGDVFNLAAIYPILSVVGLVGLIMTELTMSRILDDGEKP